MQYAWTESDPPYSLTAESNVSVQNTINPQLCGNTEDILDLKRLPEATTKWTDRSLYGST